MSTANRVIKNTGFLYAKMCMTVFISLYSTRLILAALGVSDFGIYNVVGSAITMLGFLNSTMANATQRFMSYSLGEGDIEKCKQIFNISVVLHVGVAVLTAGLLLIAMWPLFGGVLNIPDDRAHAARVVYLCLVFSTLLTIINVPYESQINSHENMLYYAVVGIFESFMKLGVAFWCVQTASDKLIVYGILMAAIPLVTLTIMKIYCHKHYEECVLSPKKYWDRGKAKEMLTFSGWNFLTAISYLFTSSGLGIVLNHFFGTLLNTAFGIAHQVNSYMTTISLQLSKATTPVIVKKAGAGNMDSMNNITIASCKFTTVLVMLFAIPCILEMPYVLKVWLKEVPEWTVLFCILQLVQTIITQMGANVTTSIFAQGNIRTYTILKSITNILPVFIVYACFKMGGGPMWLYIPMIVVWAIGGNMIVVVCAKKLCGLSVKSFISGILLPVSGIASVMLTLGYLPRFFLQQGIYRLICCVFMTTFGFIVSLSLFGMRTEEKIIVMAPIRKFLSRKKIENSLT